MIDMDLYQHHLNNLLVNTVCGEGGTILFVPIYEIINTYNIKSIIEIGFNRGSTALSFLLSSNNTIVHSIDIRKQHDVQQSLDYLNSTFDNRIHYCEGESKTVLNEMEYADLIFIDGDHSYNGILLDATLSIRLRPKFILFDDYEHPAHGSDIKKIIDICDLEIVKIYEHNNCALTKIKD